METRTDETIRRDPLQYGTDAKAFPADRGHDHELDGSPRELCSSIEATVQSG